MRTTNPPHQTGCLTADFMERNKPVSYKQAKDLKKAGFEQRTPAYYVNGKIFYPSPRVGPNLCMNFAECVPAPRIEDILNSGNEAQKAIVSDDSDVAN